jgi:DNA-directed RNA polymerase subunit RPC12/RpoP
MIVIIFFLAFITFFILYGLNSDTPNTNNTGEKWPIISIGLFILICYLIAFAKIISFDSYHIKTFIFEDHWFLSSLAFGSLFFLIVTPIESRRRAIMLSNETTEERQLREEKEAKARETLRLLQSKQPVKQRLQSSEKSYTELKCQKCGSTNLTANNKGFGLGKAAVGGILLGPVGLLGGLVGSKTAVFICLKCGNQFEK